MYPRNAATPPRIAIGAVVQISNGAVQSSGVSIAVRAEGGSEGAGGGTTSYGGSSGIVYYAPTQAETNYTAFVVTAYKTGCIPVSQTVVTTANATAGRVDVGSVAGTSQTARDLGASVLLSSGTGTGQVSLSSGRVLLQTSQSGVTIPTVTSVTNLHASAATAANQTTILARLGAFTGTGVNTVLGFFKALMRSDATDPSDVGGTFAAATDSVQAIRDRGDTAWTTGAGGSAPTVEEIRAEMDTNSTKLASIVEDTNELQTNQGNWLTATGFSTLSASDVRDALGMASANLDTVLATLATAAALQVVDDEVGAVQADLDNATDGLGALKAILDTLATSAALQVVDNEVGALQADLDNATDGLGALKALIDAVQSAVDAVQTDLDNGTDGLGALAAAIAALPSTSDMASPAEVATEIADALLTDTLSAPSGVPGASSSIGTWLAWLGTLSRNKMTFNKTTGVHALRNDSDTVDIATYTGADDGTTVTRPEWS